MAYFGVCYSPRRVTNPTADTVDQDMRIIASLGFRNVRTYGVNPPDQWNMLKARKYGLNVGLGVWAYGSQLDQTKARIDVALAQANEAQRTYGPSRLAFDLVVGNWLSPPADLHIGRLFQDEIVCLVAARHPAVRRGW